MSFTINEHLLNGDQVTHLENKKNKKQFITGRPDSIVIHYTAGSSGRSSADWLLRPEVKASAHVVIDRSGHIFQLAPFDTITWHAGTSRWRHRTHLNNYAIGIELDNAGIMIKDQHGFRAKDFKKYYPENEVLQAVHRNQVKPKYWHMYTPVQLEVCEELCRQLLKKFPGIKEIVGHEEISPDRKTDPGPAFPLDDFRTKLLAEAHPDVFPEAGLAKVTAPALNIREFPGRYALKIADPLPKGTTMKILEEKGKWRKVKVNDRLTGWVHGGYLRMA